MDLSDIKKNQRRKKNKANGENGGFNEYSTITTLVKKYKETQGNDDLLEIIKALEGIINTYTLVLTPGNANQQIYITPYMKKLLGMFLSPDERVGTNNESYNTALARVRWIMRHYTYEDIYSQILTILINVVKNLKIVGDCDCFYYIQWVMIFKVHKLIMDQTKDATVSLADISTNPNDVTNEEVLEDVLDRLSFDSENLMYEDKLLDKLCEADSINILTRSDDIFKCFSNYEKYLIYLFDYVVTIEVKPSDTVEDIIRRKYNIILNLLKYETEEELIERYDDIRYKLTLIEQEGNYR